jgi:hypothetical protein
MKSDSNSDGSRSVPELGRLKPLGYDDCNVIVKLLSTVGNLEDGRVPECESIAA